MSVYQLNIWSLGFVVYEHHIMACEINNTYLLKSRSQCIMYKPVSGAFELETKCNYGTAVGKKLSHLDFCKATSRPVYRMRYSVCLHFQHANFFFFA